MDFVNRFMNLQSNFYTVDFAMSEGEWIVIEVGDGGVSGPAPTQDLHQLYSAMQP
jgi:hypothetical protein